MIIPYIWKHNPNVPNHQPDISKVESPAKVFQNLLGQHSSGSSENMGGRRAYHSQPVLPHLIEQYFRISMGSVNKQAKKNTIHCL